MKLGTLNQFIDVPTNLSINTFHLKTQYFNSNKNLKQKRAKTQINSYDSSNKLKLLSNHISAQKFKPQKISKSNQECKINSRRSQIDEYSLNLSLFKNNNYRAQIRKKPKRSLVMLQILSQIKTKEQQNQQKMQPQNIFNQIYQIKQTFHDLKHIPLGFERKGKSLERTIPKMQLQKLHNPNSLSSEKRIEFEHCYNWAKIHKKDSTYYEEKLKVKSPRDSFIEQISERKKLLQKIKMRYQPPKTRVKRLTTLF